MTALAVYCETGSTKEAARRTGIPPTTIWQWTQQDWSDEYLAQLRIALRANMAWDLAEGSAAAYAGLKQRMIEGDAHLDAKGNVHYLPVKFRDLVIGMGVMMDKWQGLTVNLMQERMIDKTLAKLADRLMASAVPTTLPPHVETGDGVNGEDYLA